MSCFGAYGPFPRRFGASRGRSLEAIHNSILQSLGSAYDVSPGTAVWIKAMAMARALWAAQEQNRKLANQFDPRRTSDMLARWEAIFGISPPPGATVVDRRNALTLRWKRIGRFPSLGNVIKTLKEVCPNTFSALAWQSSTAASGVLKHTYSGTSSDLAGVGGSSNLIPDGTWGSSVHYVCVVVTCPASMLVSGVPGPAFYTEVGAIDSVLEKMLPAWVSFAWKYDAHGSPGFFFDDPVNLDNERFRI